jgi:hypothetical protein
MRARAAFSLKRSRFIVKAFSSWHVHSVRHPVRVSGRKGIVRGHSIRPDFDGDVAPDGIGNQSFKSSLQALFVERRSDEVDEANPHRGVHYPLAVPGDDRRNLGGRGEFQPAVQITQAGTLFDPIIG